VVLQAVRNADMRGPGYHPEPAAGGGKQSCFTTISSVSVPSAPGMRVAQCPFIN
jgi:hypothetical protein